MALKQADRLESNNPKAFGIVKATQVSGHKTVTTLAKLYQIPDCILSDSKINSDGDALGQEWFVIAEKTKYILVDWSNRRSESGWKKYSGDVGNIQAGEGIQVERDVNGTITISLISEIDDSRNTSSKKTWSIDKIKEVLQGRGVILKTSVVGGEEKLNLSINTDNETIIINDENKLVVPGVDGGEYN